MQGTDGNTGKRNSITEEELFSWYSPDKQYSYCKNRGRCVMGTAPRLSEVCDQLGEETAIKWITDELNDLAKYANCGYKLNEFQFKEMARMVLQNYQSLKLTEVMLFFNDCKSGKYLKLYGGYIDPMQLMGALREFVQTEMPRIMTEWHERNENEAGQSLADVYIGRIRSHDFSGEDGENARKVQDMIFKGEFSDDELGYIAREVGEYLIGWWAPVYAARIEENDYSGELGKTAEAIARDIRDNNVGNHFWHGGLAMKVKSILEEFHKKQGWKTEDIGKLGELRERGEITGGKHLTFEEYLLVKVKNNDFEGRYGEAARQKAKEMEEDKDKPF